MPDIPNAKHSTQHDAELAPNSVPPAQNLSRAEGEGPLPHPASEQVGYYAYAAPAIACPVRMLDEEACGRPLHNAPPAMDARPVCLMHSRDPGKDPAAFQAEINAILAGASTHNRDPDRSDFTGFVFLEAHFQDEKFEKAADFSLATFTQYADFSLATFTRNADFSSATFTQDSDFSGATFTQNATFFYATFTRNASFSLATFTQHAFFSHATFTQHASFSYATFTQDASFHLTKFGGVADFSSIWFERPSGILFHRTNQPRESDEATTSLKIRFGSTLLEDLRFEDVNWQIRNGRLVLEDEPVPAVPSPWKPHEIAADVYRRLVNNFEKVRQYELAERAFLSEMEMRRLNPRNFLFARWTESRWFQRVKSLLLKLPLVKKHLPSIQDRFRKWHEALLKRRIYALPLKAAKRVRRWIGEHFSFIYLYRLSSRYGSSYLRALFALLVLTALLSAVVPYFGLRLAAADPNRPTRGVSEECPAGGEIILWNCAAQSPNPGTERWHSFRASAFALFETTTLARNPVYIPAGPTARVFVNSAALLLGAQLALFLLALRRRFKR